jgi:hypothetical protein
MDLHKILYAKIEGIFQPPSLGFLGLNTIKSYGEPITLSSLHMGLYPSCGYVLLQGRSCTIKYLIKIK